MQFEDENTKTKFQREGYTSKEVQRLRPGRALKSKSGGGYYFVGKYGIIGHV